MSSVSQFDVQVINQQFSGLPAYGQVYNQGVQNVANGATFTFDSNGVLNGFTHVLGSDTITSQVKGVFCVLWIINGQSGGAFTFLQNNVAVPVLSYVSLEATEGLQGQGIIVIEDGDTFKFRNNTGFEVDLVQQNNFTNATVMFMQIANHP